MTPQHVRKPQTPTRTIVVMGTNTTSKIKLEFSTPLRGHNKMRSTNNIIRKPKKSSHLPLSNPTPPMHRVKQCQPPQRKTTHKLILRLERHPKLSRSQPKIYHLQVMAPNNQLLLTLLINKTKQWKRLAQFKQILLPLWAQLGSRNSQISVMVAPKIPQPEVGPQLGQHPLDSTKRVTTLTEQAKARLSSSKILAIVSNRLLLPPNLLKPIHQIKTSIKSRKSPASSQLAKTKIKVNNSNSCNRCNKPHLPHR